MQLSPYRIALVALVGAAAATDTIWVTNTVYTCPCSASTSLFTSSLTSSSHPFSHTTSSLSTKASTVTSAHTTSSSTISGTTSVFTSTTSKKITTTTTSTAPASTCIALGANCQAQTADFGCCHGTTCDFGLEVPICVTEDSTTTKSTSYATTKAISSTVTTKITTTTTSNAPAATCFALGVNCQAQTADFGCCDGTTCDFGLEVPVCIADDSTASTTEAPTTTTHVSTTTVSATTTSVAPAATCFALGADCTDQTADFGCCGGTTCDFGLDTPTCVADDD